MTATGPRTRAKSGAKRSPRRLSRDARRDQLIDVAMPLVAEHGLSGFSLDELARRADVTRNLLYHYFPRGRPDIVLAVGERAGHELTDGWLTDEAIPLQQRMAANFARFLQHAEAPSDAWVIRRLGRASSEPELHAIIDRFEEVLIEGISLNNFGTSEPPPVARLAIKGFLAFSATVLDEARDGDVPNEQVLQLVAQAAAATMQSVRSTIG
jgi:AcrR family transcriptional regulator